MAGREGVRSSARLSGATNGVERSLAPTPGEAERAAAAALRRARALRAAERAREVEDSPRVLREKCRRLARALRDAKHLVVYTGAGISTAADIPDYRGPRGVWTRLQRGETVGRVEVSRAQPTFTHMALTALWARGALKFVVSQNCDGLHARAGLPRRALAELHGDMFAERCAACRRVYLRAFDTTERTARHAHATRRLCHDCGRELRDSIVHFGERGRAAWPLNWAGALRHAAAADVVLCLGSSLKVLRRYPRLWRMQSAPHQRPALYIVNLQWTPKDSVAAMKINARCDTVMAQVARRLRLRVPRYRESADPLLAHAEPLAPPEAHTTRRPLLPTPDPAPSPAAAFSGGEDSDSSYYSLSSASATDSDDEVPLCRLAARRTSPSPRPDTHEPATLPPPLALHSFQVDNTIQVNLQSGETTILLRAEHAPTEPPPPEPPPTTRNTTDALRRFRITRPPGSVAILNGFAPATNGHRPPLLSSELESKLEESPPLKIEKDDPETSPANGSWDFGTKLRQLLKLEPRIGLNGQNFDCTADAKVKTEELRDEEASAVLAAAIIRRAVMVCRAQLYPGLHTIIAQPPPGPRPRRAPPPAPGPPPGAPAAAAECAWCLRRYSARRCLWYGAPRCTPPERRAWRRELGRRYLCACCGPDAGDEPSPGPSPHETVDDGGWYGKGYRKGRRRRR